jgi:hypothetical protein
MGVFNKGVYFTFKYKKIVKKGQKIRKIKDVNAKIVEKRLNFSCESYNIRLVTNKISKILYIIYENNTLNK